MSLIYFDDLQKKESEIPIITDKILVDLVNSIQVNDDLISFRQKQGLFGRFFDELIGADRKRQLAIDKNVNVAMESFRKLVSDFSDNLNVSNKVMMNIEEQLTDMFDQLQYRVENHGHRILSLEKRVDRQEVESKIINAIAAWQSRTYQGFHWAIQVAFVTREIVDYA